MKKYLALPLFAISPVLFAQPYINVGAGITEFDHDEDVTFTDGTHLKPDGSDGSMQISIGQRFNNNFGVELSYRNIKGSADKDFETNNAAEIPNLPNGVTGGNPNEFDEDWDSSLKAKQFALKGMYFNDLNERLTFKAGAGLTYTDYSFKYSHEQSWEEDIPNAPDWEYDLLVESGKRSEDAFGGIISAGLDYVIAPTLSKNLTVGVEASYSMDKYSKVSAAYANLGWKF